MTTEEKARAYDKAIEKIKYVMEHGVSPVLNKEDLQDIFPALREFDDERIIKAQLDYWRSVGGKEWHGVPVQETIAWLEKQGEMKTPEESLGISSEKYSEIVDQCIFGEQKQVDGFDAELNALLKKYEHLPKEEVAEYLSFYLGVIQGEPKPKWTEEDELMLLSTIQSVEVINGAAQVKIEWLKSLRKRMEEQQ